MGRDPIVGIQAPAQISMAFLFYAMLNTIFVVYNGQNLSVYRAVAACLNLKNGQEIRTEAHFWEILGANASHGISLCESQVKQKSN